MLFSSLYGVVFSLISRKCNAVLNHTFPRHQQSVGSKCFMYLAPPNNWEQSSTAQPFIKIWQIRVSSSVVFIPHDFYDLINPGYWGVRRKSEIPITTIPSSSRHSVIQSFTKMIFLNESPMFTRDFCYYRGWQMHTE